MHCEALLQDRSDSKYFKHMYLKFLCMEIVKKRKVTCINTRRESPTKKCHCGPPCLLRAITRKLHPNYAQLSAITRSLCAVYEQLRENYAQLRASTRKYAQLRANYAQLHAITRKLRATTRNYAQLRAIYAQVLAHTRSYSAVRGSTRFCGALLRSGKTASQRKLVGTDMI